MMPTPSGVREPGKLLATTISTTSSGTVRMRSTTRMSTLSTAPPK